MYGVLLFLHNITRWIVLIVAIWALIQMYRGWFGQTPWTNEDSRVNRIFVAVLGIQFLIGVVLYIVSPLTQAAMQDFGAAMRDSDLRFFAVEHVLMMLIAVAVANIGSAMARRATDAVKKHRNAAIWFTISVVIILASIPWWRPLLRGF
jgi:uncharacterized membrane protein